MSGGRPITSEAQAAELELGAQLPPLVLAPVDRTMLALFGPASGDLNPIHLDLDFARRAGMPDVFAQGMLGMAWMARALTAWVPQHRVRRLDARFQGITHLGNRISVTGRVAELLDRDGERCARIELLTQNQYGQVKIVGEAVVAVA